MKLKLLALSAATATVLTAGSAFAAVVGVQSSCGGTSILNGISNSAITAGDLSGGTAICGDASRSNLGNIDVSDDGTPISGDNDFYSLGLGGALVIEFNPVYTGPTMVIEITNGRASSSHKEAVEILGSNDGSVFTSLGFATNQTGTNDGTRGTKSTVSFTGTYAFLGFRDVTQSTFANSQSTDGFDIDAVSVAPVPLPASALLLLAGVGGLGALRARRKG